MSIINKTNKRVAAILSSTEPKSLDYILKLAVQTVVRKVVESAAKLMVHEKSDTLEVGHLETAIRSLGLQQIEFSSILFSEESSDFRTFQDELQETRKWLHKFKQPSIDARWIIIDSHIPSIDQNKIILRSHKTREHENQDYKFNIIHDNPTNFLLPEQHQLFKYISYRLEAGKQLSIGPLWNIGNLLPFVMNILMNMGPSDNRVQFLFQIIHSKALTNSLEYYLHHILAFLLEYKGKHSWEVGLEISKLISFWQFKYPHFHNIFNEMKQGYSSKIKKLAYETYFRIPPSIRIEHLEQDILKNTPEAKRFLQLLNMCWLRFNYQSCEYQKHFIEGRVGLTSDSYLQSII